MTYVFTKYGDVYAGLLCDKQQTLIIVTSV